jgi:hypothetical protein
VRLVSIEVIPAAVPLALRLQRLSIAHCSTPGATTASQARTSNHTPRVASAGGHGHVRVRARVCACVGRGLGCVLMLMERCRKVGASIHATRKLSCASV